MYINYPSFKQTTQPIHLNQPFKFIDELRNFKGCLLQAHKPNLNYLQRLQVESRKQDTKTAGGFYSLNA